MQRVLLLSAKKKLIKSLAQIELWLQISTAAPPLLLNPTKARRDGVSLRDFR